VFKKAWFIIVQKQVAYKASCKKSFETSEVWGVCVNMNKKSQDSEDREELI